MDNSWEEICSVYRLASGLLVLPGFTLTVGSGVTPTDGKPAMIYDTHTRKAVKTSYGPQHSRLTQRRVVVCQRGAGTPVHLNSRAFGYVACSSSPKTTAMPELIGACPSHVSSNRRGIVCVPCPWIELRYPFEENGYGRATNVLPDETFLCYCANSPSLPDLPFPYRITRSHVVSFLCMSPS